jgi:hypothetical protein
MRKCLPQADMIGLVHQGEFAVGRVVTFSDLRPSKIISAIHNAAITRGETQEMAAEYIRIPPGQQWIGFGVMP